MRYIEQPDWTELQVQPPLLESFVGNSVSLCL